MLEVKFAEKIFGFKIYTWQITFDKPDIDLISKGLYSRIIKVHCI